MSLSLLAPLKFCKNLITQPLNLSKFTFARQASGCRGSWPPNQPCRPGFNRNQQQPQSPKPQQIKKPTCNLSDVWRPPNLCRDPCKQDNPWQAPKGCKSTDPLKQHVPCNPPRPDQYPPPKVPGCCANRFPCYDPCNKDPSPTYPHTPWTSSRPTTWTPAPCHAALNAARYSAKASGKSGGGNGRGVDLSTPCKHPCSNAPPPCPPTKGGKPCGGGPSDPPEGPCNLPHIQATQDPPDPCRIPYYYLDPCDPDIVPKESGGGKSSCGGEPPTCPTCPTCPNCANFSSNNNPNLWSQANCRQVLRNPCPCGEPPECYERGIEPYSDFASATSVLMFLVATTYFISTWNGDDDDDDRS